jgi:diacylglycerol kinase
MNMRRRVIKTLLKFRYAFNGLMVAFRTQSSFRIHAITAGIVILAGLLLHIGLVDWILVSTAIMFVIVTELLNTSIEHVCNYIQPRYHKIIKIIKDVAAGAVLVAVLNAVVVGCLVFIPAIIGMLT